MFKVLYQFFVTLLNRYSQAAYGGEGEGGKQIKESCLGI